MKKSLLAIFVAFFAFSGQGQYYTDFGFKLGGANVLGDIGGKEQTARRFIWDMKMQETSFAFGGFARHLFHPLFAGSVHFTYGRIQGDDALSTNRPRVGRNLSFRNDIKELSLRGELYLLNIQDVGGTGRYRTEMKVYLLAGVAGFHHNPKAQNPNYNGGAWTALKDLGTNATDQGTGQNIATYGNWGLSIPTGVGLYFTHRRIHRIGWELNWMMTFTDYLDDISGFYPERTAQNSAYYDYFINRTGDVAVENLPLGFDGTQESGALHYEPGNQRGDAEYNDNYFFSTVSYSRVLRRHSFYRQNYGWLNSRGGKRRKVRAKF